MCCTNSPDYFKEVCCFCQHFSVHMISIHLDLRKESVIYTFSPHAISCHKNLCKKEKEICVCIYILFSEKETIHASVVLLDRKHFDVVQENQSHLSRNCYTKMLFKKNLHLLYVYKMFSTKANWFAFLPGRYILHSTLNFFFLACTFQHFFFLIKCFSFF